mmetsp:Transcript_27466/g.55491  ORF Transcript_27466/g.55491 Transcript_27466/m.55491 type:complete len:631 (+) Transcript_27466:101-1993(+)
MTSASPKSFSSSNLEMEEDDDAYSVDIDIESEEYGERTLSPHTVTKNSPVANNEFYRTSLRRQNCCFGFSVVTIAGLFVAAYFMMGLSFTPSNIGIFGDESHLKGGSGEVGLDASNAQVQAVIDEEITELEEEGNFGDEAVDSNGKRAKAAKIHQQFKDMINHKEKVGENKWVENKNWWKENMKNIDMAEEKKNKDKKKKKNDDDSDPKKKDKLRMRCERQKRNGRISDKCKELEMTDVDSIEDKLANHYNFTIVGEGKESMLPDGELSNGKRGKAKKKAKGGKKHGSKNEEAGDDADADDSGAGKTDHSEENYEDGVNSDADGDSDGEENEQEGEQIEGEGQDVEDKDEKFEEEAQDNTVEDEQSGEEGQEDAVENEQIDEDGMDEENVHTEEVDDNEEDKVDEEGQSKEEETEEDTEGEANPMEEENVKVMSKNFEVLEQVIHDETSFTQGISYGDDGIIYETTGLYGSSKVRRINPETFEVEMSVDTERKYFGEGSTFYRDADGNGRIIEITWREQTGFIYDSETLEIIDDFEYSTSPPRHEGWGITYDEGNREFIVSDGSQFLFFWDRDTLEVKRKVQVTRFDGRPQGQLNELEFMDGLVCCNIWHVDEIICVDPSSGKSVWEYGE